MKTYNYWSELRIEIYWIKGSLGYSLEGFCQAKKSFLSKKSQIFSVPPHPGIRRTG